MSRSIKLVLSIFIILLVIGGAAIYFVSTKINPEVIKKMAIEAIESNLKDTKANIKLVDYKLGTSVSILINDLSIINKNDKSKFLELKEIKVNVPILSILTSGGTIEVQALSPLIYVQKRNNQLNWLKALETHAGTPAKKSEPKKTVKSNKKIELPKFVERSKLNFRISDLKVFLDLGEFQKSTVDVNRIVVKNLSFTKSTAFEVKTSLKYQMEKEKFLSSEFQAIGEVFLKDLLEDNRVNLTTTLKIVSTRLDGLDIKIPDVKGKIKIEGATDDLTSLVDLTFENVASLKSEINLRNEDLVAKEISFVFNPYNIIRILDEEIQKSVSIVNFNNSEIKLQGNVKYNLESGSILPKITFETTKSIQVNLEAPFSVNNTLRGRVNDKDVNLEIDSSVMEGSVKTSINTKFDPLNIPKEINNFSPVNVNVALNDLRVSRKFLQDSLWGKKSSSATSEQSATEQTNKDPLPGTKVLFPPLKVVVLGKRIFFADQEISLSGDIKVKDDKINSKDFSFTYGKGKILTDFNIQLVDTKNIDTNFNLNFKDVYLQGFNAFFPPYLSQLKGKFVGKVDGKVGMARDLTYDIKAKMRGTDGEMKDLNVAKVLGPLLSNIKLLKGKIPKKQNVSNKFDKFYVDTQVNNSLIKLNRLEVVGHKKEFDIVTSGKVSMLDGPSQITGQLFSILIPKEFVKTFGIKKIPFRLKGKGFAIYEPDYNYTNQKLQKAGGKVLGKNAKKEINKAKKKVKTALKKEEKKIRAKAKQEEKKIKKKLEDEIPKKLKGIKF